MPWLPVLFIIIPFTELMILLKVGATWGVWPTLGLILLTAAIGYQLFRLQGLKLWLELQRKLQQGEHPSDQLLEGMVVLVAGTLMITPGLLTDIIGLFCLIPWSRRWLLARAKKHFAAKINVRTSYYQSYGDGQESNHNRTFEGSFSRQEDESSKENHIGRQD